ncbi:MAG: tetratricopeptide repeat protein [Planctomycetota bacterium]
MLHPALIPLLCTLVPARTPGTDGAPAGAVGLLDKSVEELCRLGERGLDIADPALALSAWRALQLRTVAVEQERDLNFQARVGLGRSWLMLGRNEFARAYAEDLVRERPDSDRAWALEIQVLLRGGDFQEAYELATCVSRRLGLSGPELRSAHAAALFRSRHLNEARRCYKRILKQDPEHIEALVRLGTGLLERREFEPSEAIERALQDMQRGRTDRARRTLREFLASQPDHPVALRLLGELRLAGKRAESPLVRNGSLREFWMLLSRGRTVPRWLRSYYPVYSRLSGRRQLVVAVSSMPFSAHLARVALAGGRHDILMEEERTTDASARAWLRGKRTFDGRGWDDVRGIGGLTAATGVESLDEALEGGFQTLIHELAHQVHHFSLSDRYRARIHELYQSALVENRCLDFYARVNESEYFAQGVEAWFSFTKGAGQPVTHGHTHFELGRKDPELCRLIGEIADWDPFAGPDGQRLLELAMRAALCVGRAEDARTILGLMQAPRPELRRSVARAWNRFRVL